MSATFDVIVLGLGVMGASTCYELARRGRRVLGLEQYPMMHFNGSSHGFTRIIRTAYAEHPAYVPLVRRAFERWYELEQDIGRHLLTPAMCLNVGPGDGPHISGVREAVRQHGLAAEELNGAEISRRFPVFRFPDRFAGILEPAAGILHAEECVRAAVDAAVAHGAEIQPWQPVRQWTVVGDGVQVTTDKQTYQAARLVITAGPWATRLLADVGLPLAVMRQTPLWFGTGARAADFRRDRFPVFIAEVPEGVFYGVPALSRDGVKVARHYGAPELPNLDAVEASVTDADIAPVRSFLDAYLPDLGPFTFGQVCLYTVTPDRHFVVDVHPAGQPIAFAAGFSGHGFKFGPVIGEILADLVETGTSRYDIRLFSAKRFQTQPS